MRKDIEMTFKNKKSGIIVKHACHHWLADSKAYYLEGVKGMPLGMAFNKAEWERL